MEEKILDIDVEDIEFEKNLRATMEALNEMDKEELEKIENKVYFNVDNINKNDYFLSKKSYKISEEKYSVVLFCNRKSKKINEKKWVITKPNDEIGVFVDYTLIQEYDIKVVFFRDKNSPSKKVAVNLFKKINRYTEKKEGVFI